MPKRSLRKLRPFILLAVVTFTVAEIVALSPSSVEESDPSSASTLDPESLVIDTEEEPTLAPGLPKNRVPEDLVDRFNYVSSQGTEKQWNLIADQAIFYRPERLVHARKITAYLYDPDGKITTINGLEAKYFMNKKDLEIFGNVKTTFPDGFTLNSEYLRYRPQERIIEIPIKYAVSGTGLQQDDRRISFESHGFNYLMSSGEITLPQTVHVTFSRDGTQKSSDNPTDIFSDHCMIRREIQLAHFTMFATRPNSTRFVEVKQPGSSSRARKADFRYGDSAAKTLQYMTLYEDVLMRDLRKKKGKGKTQPDQKYATAGRADFDSRRDIVVLTEFPQVYQGEDTVTGDKILLHRDTDIVEVENSNAFTQGEQEDE